MEFSWNYFFLCFLLCNSAIALQDYLGLNIQMYDYDHHVTPNSVCGNKPRLTKTQQRLCQANPRAVASAFQGLQLGIHECKAQFKNHRWNCNSLETKNNMPFTSPFLTKGSKETAFSYAITSAGVAHKVAHACSLGKISECACRPEYPPNLSAGRRRQIQNQLNAGRILQYHHAGCNHDINFAMTFSQKFLDPKKTSQASRAAIHNNRVGRLIVASNMKQACKCHGMSGSCSQETCWWITPSFKEVGIRLKKKYQDSRIKHRHTNDVRSVDEDSTSSYNSPHSLTELVYYEESLNYCRDDKRFAVKGTQGRICDHLAPREDPKSCHHLCCGRGSTIHKETYTERCHCKFHWCCHVECRNCTSTAQVAICN